MLNNINGFFGMILDQENLYKLQDLFAKQENTNLLDIIVSNINIDYIDYPVIDHSARSPYIDFPDIIFKVTFSLIYVYIDMQKHGLNIDNPQFISENVIKEYLLTTYFQDMFNNVVTLKIKETIYDDFNIDFHINKNSPAGKETLDIFNNYCLKESSLKINIDNATVNIAGILCTYYDV